MTQTAWAWVRNLGGSAILAVLLWRLGSDGFVDGLRVLNVPVLLGAAGIGLLTTVFSAWRWSLTARGLGIRLPLRGAVADYYQALFLNATLPGGLLGDVHRAVRNGRDAGDVGRGVRAVVLERSAGQFVLVVVAVAVLLSHPSMVRSAPSFLTVPLMVIAVAAGVLALVVFAVLRLKRGTSRWTRALRTTATEVRRGMLARQNWPGIVFASAVVLAGHLATFLLAARAAGSSASAARLLPLMVLALLVMALPVNIGGWGPREGVCAWAFSAAGLGATQGLTIAVVYGLFALVASLPGVAVLVVRFINRPRPTSPLVNGVRPTGPFLNRLRPTGTLINRLRRTSPPGPPTEEPLRPISAAQNGSESLTCADRAAVLVSGR